MEELTPEQAATDPSVDASEEVAVDGESSLEATESSLEATEDEDEDATGDSTEVDE